MSALWLHLIGVSTLLLFMTFIGIWIWAWDARHAGTFARLASLPVIDESDEARHSQDARS